MWIVTVMEPYYPSVFAFDNYEEARAKYKELAIPCEDGYHGGYDPDDKMYKVTISSVLESFGEYEGGEVDWT